MADRSSAIRNVALVGHGDSGKTTFVEHALHRAGVIPRCGTVPDGNTVSDHDPEESSRQHSIDVSVVHVPWLERELQILDCPGYPDFCGVALAGLAAADTVVVFVDATAGVGVNTRRMWAAAGELGKPRVIVISKIDADNADPERVLAQVKEYFGERCLAVHLPDKKGPAVSAIVRCFRDKEAEGEVAFGDPAAVREEFYEAVVEANDDMLERYLSGEHVSIAELAETLTKAMIRGSLTPVLFLSSAKDVGVENLLNFIAKYGDPATAPVGALAKCPDGDVIELTADGPFVASVFKITSDQHVGKLAYLRAWRGALPADHACWNSSSDSIVKLAHPMQPQGKELTPLKTVVAGDLFCIAKVDDLHIGSTVTDPAARLTVNPPKFPTPMVHLALTPHSRGDEHKIAAALAKLTEEDPTFTVERSHETTELVASGVSTLQLQMMLHRLEHRYKVVADTALPRVPLKETILIASEGRHRHKKQSGGRGQFGEVSLRVAPAERGSGFEFVDKTVGGSIPNNFVPAIEKGIRETLLTGVIAGYEVVDIHVEVYDGKHHAVDSSEAAFKIAGGRAFRDAFSKAKPVLLEPVMHIEIDVPSRFMGDISGDLNTRRGRIQGMVAEGTHQIIKAQVPLSEIQRYSTDLRSITAGEGQYTLEFSHLDVVPSNVAQRLIDAHVGGDTDD